MVRRRPRVHIASIKLYNDTTCAVHQLGMEHAGPLEHQIDIRGFGLIVIIRVLALEGETIPHSAMIRRYKFEARGSTLTIIGP